MVHARRPPVKSHVMITEWKKRGRRQETDKENEKPNQVIAGNNQQIENTYNIQIENQQTIVNNVDEIVAAKPIETTIETTPSEITTLIYTSVSI